MGAPSTHKMSGLSLAKHVHGRMGHVHGVPTMALTYDVLRSRVMVFYVNEFVGSRVCYLVYCFIMACYMEFSYVTVSTCRE